MQIVVWSGQRAPVGGWFLDPHGHRMLIRAGDLAPICPFLGPAPATSRLLREIPAVPSEG